MAKAEKNKRIIKEALLEFFASPEGKTIIHEALNDALHREMTFQQVKDPETNMPISPPRIKTENVNIIDQIMIYFSRMEGALQGLQNKVIEIDTGNKRLLSSYKKDQLQIIKGFENLPRILGDSKEISTVLTKQIE